MPATSNRVDQLTPSLRAVAQRFTAPGLHRAQLGAVRRG